MNTEIRNLCIALAGIFQAARLVQQTSQGVYRNEVATRASLASIYSTDPESVASVYGNIATLQTGLEVLASQLGNDNKQRDIELTAYAVKLMHLERKLGRQPALLETISSGIDKAREQLDFFGQDHPSVIAGLAEVYRQTVSTLHPRIMVKGEQGVLTNPDSQNMIRALLLAGMRAAVLWHQCGGSRLKLVFRRKALLACTQELLQEARRTG